MLWASERASSGTSQLHLAEKKGGGGIEEERAQSEAGAWAIYNPALCTYQFRKGHVNPVRAVEVGSKGQLEKEGSTLEGSPEGVGSGEAARALSLPTPHPQAQKGWDRMQKPSCEELGSGVQRQHSCWTKDPLFLSEQELCFH